MFDYGDTGFSFSGIEEYWPEWIGLVMVVVVVVVFSFDISEVYSYVLVRISAEGIPRKRNQKTISYYFFCEFL